MTNKTTYGLIGALLLIVATMGGKIYLTPDQLDNAYICNIDNNIVIADHLSSTSKTAYWNDESKVCRNGQWIKLKEYAKDNNIEINVLLENKNKKDNIEISPVRQGVVQYRCSKSCEVI